MTKRFDLRCAALGFGLMAASMATAQDLYVPTRSAGDQGITLTGWGSGRIAESDDRAVEGTTSLRLTSRNFFQGGIIRFGQPVDLSASFSDKTNLLNFTFSVPTTTSGGSGGAAGTPGNAGGLGAPGRGGMPGGTPGGTPGNAAPGGSSAQSGEMPLKKVRLVITTTDGKKSEAYLDISTSVPNAQGWFNVGLPLQAINGFDKTNKIVSSVALAGDAVATFYLGKLNISNDSTPVYAEVPVTQYNLAFGDEVNFQAMGYAGATPVKFLWDFDATDGVQVDAEGQSVIRRFRKQGTFTVTLTAVDIYGLKQPFTTTIQVTVN